MKKVLFVLGTAEAGGTMTSLFNLLSLIDKDKIEAHLFLQKHTGVLLSRAKEFNLLPQERIISSITRTRQELNGCGIKAFFVRGCYVILHKLFGVKKANKFFYKKSVKKLNNKYDVVVAYQEGHIADYVQHIKAPKRVAWCHTAYNYFVTQANQEEYWQRVYSKFNHVACVSQVVLNSIVNVLNYPKNQIEVLYNTIPKQFIIDRAKEKMDIAKQRLTFVSSGRYVFIKRFDRIVLAARKLKEEGIDFIWYLLGNGEKFQEISTMIKENDLQGCVIQVGAVENPFVYYKIADCFVMASETEGQPMVLNEALTLGIPVITTEFPSSKEVVGNKPYGMIVANNDDEFVKGVAEYVKDEQLRHDLKEGAKSFIYDNQSILDRVYKILGI